MKTLIRELGKLRDFRARRRARVSWRIRLRSYQDWLQSRLAGEWQNAYIELENGDIYYVPTPIERHGQILITQPPSHDALIDKFCRPKSTCIDVGANIGQWAVPMAKCVGPQGRLFAFEPIPLLADALDKTFAVNGLTHATAHAIALSDHNGRATFHINLRNDKIVDSGVSSLEHRAPGAQSIEVATLSLDDFLRDQSVSRVSFIKIDVEGHEHAVLAGARETLAAHRPALLIETGQETPETRRQIHNQLTALGYRMIGMRYENHLLPADWDAYLECREPFRTDLFINVLLVPRP